MNILQIQYLLAVAECGSISKAAESLFVSQPAVSLQMKKLESELGCSLLFRTAQGVSLTPEGEAFREGARPVLEAWEQLEAVSACLAKEKRERLTIHLGPRVFSNGLFPKIVAFFEQHPDITAAFTVAGGGNFLEDLRTGAIDVALNYVSSYLKDLSGAPRFFQCELIQEPQCVLTGLDSALAQQERVSFDILRDHTLIAAPEASLESTVLDRILQDHGITPGRMYRLDGVDTSMEMVRAGTGIVLGPASFADHYGVRAVPLYPPFAESLSFVCLRENKDRAGLKAFREYLMKMCQETEVYLQISG